MRWMLLIAVLMGMPWVSYACQADTDCKGNRICEAGTCVSPDAASTSSPVSVEVPHKDATMSLFMNVLGILQFGLTPTLEFGGKVAGNIRLRLGYFGLLGHVLAAGSDDSLQLSTIGGGGGLRFYIGQGNLRGFFLGGGLEYLQIITKEGGWSENLDGIYTNRGVVPTFEFGYRWVFDSGFNLGAGLNAGVFVPVSASAEDANGSSYHDEWLEEHHNPETTPFGYLRLDLGWLL